MDIFGQDREETGPDRKGRKGPGMPKVPRGGQFWGNLLTIILIFLILISVYSFVVENQGKVEDVPLSLLASELNLGLVSKIVVKGDEL